MESTEHMYSLLLSVDVLSSTPQTGDDNAAIVNVGGERESETDWLIPLGTSGMRRPRRIATEMFWAKMLRVNRRGRTNHQ